MSQREQQPELHGLVGAAWRSREPTKYVERAVKVEPGMMNRIANIVEAPSNVLTVTDEIDGLYMVSLADPEKHRKHYPNIRGLVVDPHARLIVARGIPYEHPVSLIPQRDSQGNPSFMYEEGGIHYWSVQNEQGTRTTLQVEGMRYSIFSDGVMLRAFLYKEKEYLCTVKRFDITNSRWGNSPTFKEMWDQAGMRHPRDPQHTHVYIVEHPSLYNSVLGGAQRMLRLISRGDPNLHPKALATVMESQFFARLVAIFQRDLTSDETSTDPINVQYSRIHTREDEFNPQDERFVDRLKYWVTQGSFSHVGLAAIYTPDERLSYGEALMAYQDITLPTGVTNRTYIRLESPAYSWRVSINHNEPSIPQQFFILAGTDKMEQRRSLPAIDQVWLEKVIDDMSRLSGKRVGLIDVLEDMLANGLEIPRDKMHPRGSEESDSEFAHDDDLLMSYACAVPIDKQGEALKAFHRWQQASSDLPGQLLVLWQAGELVPKHGNPAWVRTFIHDKTVRDPLEHLKTLVWQEGKSSYSAYKQLADEMRMIKQAAEGTGVAVEPTVVDALKSIRAKAERKGEKTAQKAPGEPRVVETRIQPSKLPDIFASMSEDDFLRLEYIIHRTEILLAMLARGTLPTRQ